MDPVLPLLERLPLGWSEVSYAGRRWGVLRTAALGGRSQKLWAEDLGGTAFVSANLYVGDDGVERFRPCEMPARRVLDFLEGLEGLEGLVDPAAGAAEGHDVEDQPDDQQDRADRGEDRDVGDEADDEQDQAEDDHGGNLLS